MNLEMIKGNQEIKLVPKINTYKSFCEQITGPVYSSVTYNVYSPVTRAVLSQVGNPVRSQVNLDLEKKG